MSVVIGRSGKKLTEEDLALFETRTGLRIPGVYRGFLLKHNGGEPYPDRFHSVDLLGAPVIYSVREFNGLNREHSDLYNDIQILYNTNDRLPKDVFPIACDHFGNRIVLGLDGSARGGRIYFWHHDQAEGEQEVIEVAPSFEAFLEMLCIPPEVAAVVEPPDWLADPEASHEKEPAPPEPPPEQLDLFR